MDSASLLKRRGHVPATPSPSARATSRQLVQIEMALLLLAYGTCAHAGALSVSKTESLRRYAQIAVHGALTPAEDTHVVSPLPANFWDSPFTVIGAAGTLEDLVTATHSAQHLVAPHPGEPAPGPRWEAPVLAPAVPLFGFGISPIGATAVRDHVHRDYFDHGLVVLYIPPSRVLGYAYTSHGLHDPVSCASRSGALGGQQCVPPTPSHAFGSASLGIDMSDQTITLALAVRGIQRAEVLGASIRAGATGENGPMIFDVGPGPAWEDLEGVGIGRMILQAQFPPEYVTALLAGRTYLELRTMAYPDGEIRGQLEVAPLVLGETGAPHPVLLDDQPTYLGYSSGSLPDRPERWVAVPFDLPPAGAVVKRIDLDWFASPGYEAETVNYIIWQRNGLAPPMPGDERAIGTLGPYQPGRDDPRTPGADEWLHVYDGLSIPLEGGGYYFTMYASGIGAGNTTGFSDSPWLTGGDRQDESLERPFMWRSTGFPNPGFEPYDNPAIQPSPGQDPDDRWNPSFSILGHPNHFLALTVPSGNGEVTKEPDLPAYPYGMLVTLTAAPHEGSAFVGWGGDASGSANPLQVSVVSDMTISAVFGSVGIGPGMPVDELTLRPIRPTPTSGPVQIDFALPRECSVRLSVFDMQGREVTRLLDGMQPSGRHQAWWDTRTARGPAPSGVYVVRLTAPGRTVTQRLVVSR